MSISTVLVVQLLAGRHHQREHVVSGLGEDMSLRRSMWCAAHKKDNDQVTSLYVDLGMEHLASSLQLRSPLPSKRDDSEFWMKDVRETVPKMFGKDKTCNLKRQQFSLPTSIHPFRSGASRHSCLDHGPPQSPDQDSVGLISPSHI